jgi:hypothetical protein
LTGARNASASRAGRFDAARRPLRGAAVFGDMKWKCKQVPMR